MSGRGGKTGGKHQGPLPGIGRGTKVSSLQKDAAQPKNNNNKPPKPKGQDQAPKITKKQIENEQQALLKTQLDQLSIQIADYEREKLNNPRPLEQSFTLVRNARNQLDKIADFSSHWKEDISFLPYLPQDQQQTLDVNANQEILENINLDLSKLLKKEYRLFWSQVAFDESFQLLLDSFLRYCERPYERSLHTTKQSTKDNSSSLENMAFRRMYSVIHRICQNQETHYSFMTKDFYADLIWDQQLLDVPKLIDICTLYGNASFDDVSAIVNFVFDAQPKYWTQLAEVYQQTIQTFTEMQNQISKIKSEDIKSLTDVIDYILDLTCSLSAFLATVPRAGTILGSTHTSLFEIHLPHLYEVELPKLLNFTEKHPSQKAILSSKLNWTKESILSLGCSLLEQHYFRSVLNRLESKAKREKAVDSLFHVLQLMLNRHNQLVSDAVDQKQKQQQQSFFHDLAKNFPLQSSLYEVKDSDLKYDTSQLTYFQTLLDEILGKFTPQPSKKGKHSNATKNPQLEEAIAQILALIPDLGEGFIEKCLEVFNNNAETVIDRIFENNLPPHLASLDRKMPRVVVEETPILSSRRNIYDDDEFDIMANETIDSSKVHKKKPANIIDAKAFLDDKSDISEIKSKYLDYLYDDEYDDAYDNFEGEYQLAGEQTAEEAETIVNKSTPQGKSDETEENNEDQEEDGEDDEPVSGTTTGGSSAGAVRGNPRGRGTSSPSSRGGRGRKDYKAKSHNRKDQSARKHKI